MPYITVHDGRYLAEHSCNNYHYGDMTKVRKCCVEDANKRKEDCLKYALTTSHPNYLVFVDSWNNLTDAERAIVGDIIQCPGIANGFKAAKERQKQNQ